MSEGSKIKSIGFKTIVTKRIFIATLMAVIPTLLIFSIIAAFLFNAPFPQNRFYCYVVMLGLLSVYTCFCIVLVYHKLHYTFKNEKQYANELEFSNHQLKQAYEIIESSSIVVFEWTLVPGVPVKYVTNNISNFGYSAEEFYTGAIDYWDFVYEEDRERTQEIVWNARKENLTENKHTYRVKCKNGEIRWVEEWTLLERDSQGNPVAEKGILRDITDQVEAERKIHHLSFHDKLTGLHNRAFYDDALKKLDSSKEHPFSIVIGDMNGLKLANDAFGHPVGDELIKTTANIIKSACRKGDIVARIGGDEFSIILPNASREVASMVCSRIRAMCDAADSAPIQPSIALGYACKSSDLLSLSEILREAEDNMYKNKLNESKSIRSSIISSLKATLEEKSIESKEHSQRLKDMSLVLGKALDFTDSMMDELALTALMHDIGNIAVPDDILLKNGKLTNKEWETMSKHAEIGYHIILSSPKMSSIAEYILAHHEKWDGSGYPRSLKGEEIPIISRVISLVDAYDAMVNDRPYRKAMNKSDAILELERCSGSQFDPQLVKVFVALLSKQLK